MKNSKSLSFLLITLGILLIAFGLYNAYSNQPMKSFIPTLTIGCLTLLAAFIEYRKKKIAQNSRSNNK